MLILFEFDGKPIRPGIFRSRLGGKRFVRVWCLWFAIAVFPGSIREYGEACRNSEWRTK